MNATFPYAALGLLAPVVLVVSMRAAFKALHARFGHPAGYLLGFGLYWLGWCLLFPALLLGGGRLGDGAKALTALFAPRPAFAALPWAAHLMLWLPLAFPLFFVFLPKVRKASPAILLASLALGVVIAITEEILWRGVYLALFPGSLLLGVLYPSLMFAIWHLAPQSVVENRMPGGAWSFVAYALVLGLCYAFAAKLTGSIFWPTVSHAIHDSLGLGGFAYAGSFRVHSSIRGIRD